LGGGVPRWLGDDSSDDDKKKEDSNDMDETPAVDETIQENKY
jgi:hypothetical protein